MMRNRVVIGDFWLDSIYEVFVMARFILPTEIIVYQPHNNRMKTEADIPKAWNGIASSSTLR